MKKFMSGDKLVFQSRGGSGCAAHNTGGGGGVNEAPQDGLVYGRSDGGWVEINSGQGVRYRQENMPSGADEGDLWFNPTTQQMKVFETGLWVSLAADGGHF